MRGLPRRSEWLPHQLVAALAQHRMATLTQLHAMLRPGATRRTVSNPLTVLHERGLVDFVVLPQSHRARAWFLTADGARIANGFPELRGRPARPVASADEASLKSAHTLTVVRAHLAFAADARRRGDEHGFLDWIPEAVHAVGGCTGELVVSDALLHYTRVTAGTRTPLRALVEVDRTTMSSQRLTARLVTHARLHAAASAVGRHRPAQPGTPHGRPAWSRGYSLFPAVLFVLTGAGRPELAHRIEDLQATAAEHPDISGLAEEVPLGAAVLEDLEEHGPSAAIWTPLTGGGPRPWTHL
ncbi:replication-relaxation family protein [Streptomyces mangrovisoli]|uniref:Uncharacterized protein n=1 Tax=Streptomyces mangrovisoli TaxID=1428628 RepID=A0A1J4NRC1_9ACTN|nr:replication-relaxation family protein [Streptomyces mangrovisoli]OIJ64993.1 hypothetical protein WN71_026120 [Streptomyces mangrovisoli]